MVPGIYKQMIKYTGKTVCIYMPVCIYTPVYKIKKNVNINTCMCIYTHLSTSAGTKGITAVYLKLTQRCQLTVFQFKKWYKRLKKVYCAASWSQESLSGYSNLRTEILLDRKWDISWQKVMRKGHDKRSREKTIITHVYS